MAKDCVYTSVRIDLDDVLSEMDTDSLLQELKARRKNIGDEVMKGRGSFADDMADAVLGRDWAAAESYARLYRDKTFFDRQIKTYGQIKTQKSQ